MTKARPWAVLLCGLLLAASGASRPANLAVTTVGLPPFEKYGSGDSGPIQVPRSGRMTVHVMIFSGSCQWQSSNDSDAKVAAGTAGWTPSPAGTVNADSTGPSEEVVYAPTKYLQSVGACAWGIFIRGE